MPYPYFTDRAQIKAAGVPITADVTLADLLPHIARAEQDDLLPLIGRATLDAANAAQPASWLDLVRPVLAAYAARKLAAVTQRLTTSTGSEALPGQKENASTVKLNEQHLAALDANAASAVESLLTHLEENPQDYPAWHASIYCTVFPRRYFQNIEQIRCYPNAPQDRPTWRRAQGALAMLTDLRVQRVTGYSLHARLIAELDLLDSNNEPKHAQVLSYIRTALAGYLVNSDRDQMHVAECALVQLRIELQRRLDDYPEFVDSPCYVPTDIGPTVSAHTFNAFV